MKVQIDPNSGFCFGVVFAIQQAEDELERSGELYCLGDIVHNNMEVERLENKGLKIVDQDAFRSLKDCKVLIRAHGEPPETYQIAKKNNIQLIDASCPVVLKLQNRVRESFMNHSRDEEQMVIYGELGHAEVNGLVGQTGGKAIVVKTEEDLEKIDFSKPIHFFSQTTKSTAGFNQIRELIREKIVAVRGEQGLEGFNSNDTLCRQVSNREPQLRVFSKENDVIVFVSGKKSSNGKALYGVCKEINERSYFISEADELDNNWFTGADTVGICGATSTPMWLMEKVAERIRQF